mgnify:CR=1 FL=1
METKKIVALSGGFDPLHIGHIQLFKDAAEYGNVVVILNSDEWLIKKRGYCFMPFSQRKMLLEEIPYVETVMPVRDMDGTICAALRKLKPDFFGNGGSRKKSNTPEAEKRLCAALNITMLWNLGENAIQNTYIWQIQNRTMKEAIRLLEKNEEVENACL